MTKLVNFIDLSQDKLEIILEWRNNVFVRENMYSKHIISLQEHLNFTNNLKTSITDLYFLVLDNDLEIGVIYFNNITESSCTMGLYANPNIQKVGSLLMKSIIDYAFNRLKCQTIQAEVFEKNEKAIYLYKKFAFKQIDKKENIIYMELENENRQF